MAWTSQKTWVTGEIVLSADVNIYFRDGLRYLKGQDGVVQIQDGITMSGTGTASYFQPPVLTTTQRNAIASPANGMVIYNTTDGKLQKYEGTAWRSDLAYGGTLTYLAVPSMATGDIFYASSGTSITRLAAGTAGQVLKTQGGTAAPSWGAGGVLTFGPTGTVGTVFSGNTATAWGNLDFGTSVGSAQAIVMFQVSGVTGLARRLHFVRSGELERLEANMGTSGVSDGILTYNVSHLIFLAPTNTSGMMRWISDGISAVNIDMKAYWK